MIVEAHSEEKANLVRTIEELKLSAKNDNGFMESTLFNTLATHNQALIDFISVQDRFVRQLEEQLQAEIQKGVDLQIRIREEYQASFLKDLKTPVQSSKPADIAVPPPLEVKELTILEYANAIESL
jgi:hypothetical protein